MPKKKHGRIRNTVSINNKNIRINLESMKYQAHKIDRLNEVCFRDVKEN